MPSRKGSLSMTRTPRCNSNINNKSLVIKGEEKLTPAVLAREMCGVPSANGSGGTASP